MKLSRHAPGRSGTEADTPLTAILLLNLKDNGAVRVDIKMGSEQISVGFFVEDEGVRRRFAEGLPMLSKALSPLAKQCYCRVDVAPGLMMEVSKEEGRAMEKLRLDIQA